MANLNKKTLPESVDFALKYIADGIACRRKSLSIRQADLGLDPSRLSKLENGKDGMVSTLLIVLDNMDMLDDFLEALPFDEAVTSKRQRVRLKSQDRFEIESNVLKVGEPLSSKAFKTMISKHPDKDIPVVLRAANILRSEGYAIRLERDGDNSTYLATTIEAAKTSEKVYMTADGEIGGKKHLSITLSAGIIGKDMNSSKSIWRDAFISRVSELLEPYSALVVDVKVANNAKEHTVRHNTKIIKNSFIAESIDKVMADLAMGQNNG